MDFLIGAITFFFGTIIGSFLNVIIFRFNTSRGVFHGRSFCFSCGKKLSPKELVPLLSYIVQGGRCIGCGSKISSQYPIVEALTGFLFVLVFNKYIYLLPTSFTLFVLVVSYLLLLFSILLILSFYDLRHKIIPDLLVYIFSFFALLGPFVLPGECLAMSTPCGGHVLAGLILSLPLAAIWYFSHGRMMGFGDAKLALGIGFFLGISKGITAIIFAFWIGALVGLSLLLIGRIKTRPGSLLSRTRGLTIKSEVPFGPFLALGMLIVFFSGIDFSSLARIFSFGS